MAIINTVKKWFLVDRFLCTACGKTFTLLLDFLLPFKHYTAAEIEEALRHFFGGGRLSESHSEADESTLRRWWNEFSYKMQQWAGSLESKVFDLCGQAPSVLQVFPHPLERLEKVLSRLLALPSRWAVITKTIRWLNSSHPLCLS